MKTVRLEVIEETDEGVTTLARVDRLIQTDTSEEVEKTLQFFGEAGGYVDRILTESASEEEPKSDNEAVAKARKKAAKK